MNTNTKRIALAAIAIFYVVLGGLWASNHFPLQKFSAQHEVQAELERKMGFDAAFKSKEYRASMEYQTAYAVSAPDVHVTLGRIALYKTLLFWGTIALAVGGGVLFLTRGRQSQPTQTGAQ